MSAGRPRPPSRRALAAYVHGEVTPSESAAIEAALAANPDLRQLVAELRRVKQRFMAPPPDAETIDVAAAIRAATLGGGQAAGAGSVFTATVPAAASTGRWWRVGVFWRQRRPAALVAAVAAACAAAVVLVGALPEHEHRTSDQRRAKAAAGSSSTAEISRFTGVRAFRTPARGGAAKRLAGRLPGREGLFFDYVNAAERPFSYLMIFGVSAGGDLYWYFPAYGERRVDGGVSHPEAHLEKDNPASIAISAGGRASLPEIVYHDLPPGRLVLHALFTARPLRVLEVEGWIRGGRPGDPLPWRPAYEQLIETNVVDVDAGEDANGRTPP